jgi:signal transduction histidine kinase
LYDENKMAASTGLPMTTAGGRAPAAEAEARGPSATSAPPAPVAGALRPRLAIGVVAVLSVMALQLANDAVAGKEGARLVARLIYMGTELPLLMFALTAAFRRSLVRDLTAAQGLAIGVAIATTVGCVYGLAYGGIAMHVPALRIHYPNGVSLVRTTLFGVLSAQLYFGLWSLAFAYPFAVDSARTRVLEAARLRSEAEVARLRAHLEPHFLLNTLNAIAGLVTEEPREARRLLSCLGDLLRDAVQETGEQQSLQKQIAWLRRYGEILEARHRGALRMEWEVAPESEQALLPRFLLQPLVENAVKHGALRRGDREGRVVVRTHRKPDGTLVCEIEDNGPGMPDASVREGAFGLHAVRRRLALEAPSASLRHESSPEGTISIIEIGAPAQA